MDLDTFQKAVKVQHLISNLEKSLRVLEARPPESFAMEFNTPEAAACVKKALASDLSVQINSAKKELVSILAG